MAKTKAMYEEVIDEIGTQTLARFGLNIFSLNTYAGYNASVKSTNIISNTYNRHKNNKVAFGQYFEDIDVGQKNITSAIFNKGEKTYTTDELADIKKVSDILSSGKKIENLNAKDRGNFDFVMRNYSDEIESINSTPSMKENANKNDTYTDTVTFNKDSKIIEKSQHKVIKDTNGLLKDRYLDNNDVFTVPFDDYKKHKKNLEVMIEDKSNPEKAEKAKRALDMLHKNNVTNRLMSESPRATAILTQTAIGTGHIAQAGFSDAVVVALSTLANGAIFEIKDAYNGDNSISIAQRMRRLLKKVLEEFSKTFKRGASFGALDVGVGILSQIFKSISSKLLSLWKSMRNSMKSIFNAIYDYFTGKIKTYQELLSVIIKGLLSAVLVVGTLVLESELEILLSSFLTPTVASFVAPALAIVVASIAVVVSMKSIDMALNALFGIFAKRDIAKMKLEEVEALYAELMPELIREKEELQVLITSTYQKRKLNFDTSFRDFKKGLSSSNIEDMMNGLIGINSMYSKKLQYQTFEEFDDFMFSDESFKF